MEGERGKLALGWRICGDRDLIGEREERFKVDLFSDAREFGIFCLKRTLFEGGERWCLACLR